MQDDRVEAPRGPTVDVTDATDPAAGAVIPPSRVSHARGAAVVALLALVLNLIGIGWGLPSGPRTALSNPHLDSYSTGSGLHATRPYDSLHPDEEEPILSLSNMDPAHLDLNPHRFLYPTLWYYASGVAIESTALVRGVPVRHDQGSYLRKPADAAALFLPGRVLTALWAALGVALIVLLAGGMGLDRRHAVLAGLLLALSPLWVRNSHYLTVDVPAAVFMSAAALAAWWAAERERSRLLVMAGILAGLAASTKYPAGLVVVLVPWAAVHLWRAGSLSRRQAITATVVAGIAGSLAFALTSPYVLLDFRTARSQIHDEVAAVGGSPSASGLLRQLVWAQGLPLAVVGLVALAALLPSLRARSSQFLLLWTASGSLTLATARTEYFRYLIPILPPLAVASALLLARVGTRTRVTRASATAVAVAVVLFTGAYSVDVVSLLARPTDVRVRAGQVLADGLPTGADIGIFGGPALYNPVIDGSRYHITRLGSPASLSADPDAVVLSTFPAADPGDWLTRSGWLRRHRYRVVRLRQWPARVFTAGTGMSQPGDVVYLFCDLTIYIARR